jgi:YfiR/HmsC-like
MIDAIRKRKLRQASCKLLRDAILVALAAILSVVCAPAQQRPTESQVKAAYLYNFGKFVTWQADQPATDSLVICVLGKDPFGAVLDATVAGENINGKPITVTRLARLQDAAPCRILFISSSEQKRLRPILAAVQRLGMLTVSDIPSFAQQGGIIEFVNQEDKIRFEVNLDAAAEAHLVLSSQLLKVASKVIDNDTPQPQP